MTNPRKLIEDEVVRLRVLAHRCQHAAVKAVNADVSLHCRDEAAQATAMADALVDALAAVGVLEERGVKVWRSS